MNCVKCDSTNVTLIFNESIKCSHCNEEIVICVFICRDCGIMWRDIDGAVDDIISTQSPLKNVSVEKMIETILSEQCDYVPLTMNECIHRCIKCNSISYETSETTFRCPVCGFEWEVIGNG